MSEVAVPFFLVTSSEENSWCFTNLLTSDVVSNWSRPEGKGLFCLGTTLTLRIPVFSGGLECLLTLPSLFLSSLFGPSSFYLKKNVFLQQARVTYKDGTLIKELCPSAWHLGMSASHFIAYWLTEEGPAQCGSFLSVFPGSLCENSRVGSLGPSCFPSSPHCQL